MTEPDWWPRDPHGYVFLARAVEKIGATMHDDWTGEEAITEDVAPLPADRTSFWDRQRADILLNKHRPDLGRPDFVIGASVHEFTDEHWRIACKLAQQLHTDRQAAIQRLKEVHTKIVTRCEAGDLLLRIRPVDGGEWQDFQKEWWNTDKWRLLFDRCQIDPEYPFKDRPRGMGDNKHWMFATSDSLLRVSNAASSVATYFSGAPGRPTSSHLVEEEAKKRIAAGNLPSTLEKFGDALSEWLIRMHPNAAPMTSGTIQNAVRHLWRNRPQK